MLSVLGACAIIAGGVGYARSHASGAVELTAGEVVRVQGGRAVLVLREKNGVRRLPVPLDRSEAQELEATLRGGAQRTLAGRAVEALSGRIAALVIDEASDQALRGHLEIAAGARTVRVGVNVADGLAAALQARARIHIDSALLDQSGVSPDDLRSVRAREPPRHPAPVHRI